MNYKDTLNLPRTEFPMRADLVGREPERLAKWAAVDLDARAVRQNEGGEKFILHDGPPFANGDVHIGTALNKTIKDILVKYHRLRGKHAPYVPGWDCHGLPIEHKVIQQLRAAGKTDSDPIAIRTACEEYARKYIDLQRNQFRRLGILGTWDSPYLTFDRKYEAEELRLFAELVGKGFVYRGKKPVYWSIPCKTALAEAEVEYREHTSQSVFVKFPLVDHPGTFILIWTTTPWTLPANLAVAYNTTFDYSLVRVENELYIVSALLLDQVAKACGWGGFEIQRSLQSEHLASLSYRHPFCDRTGRMLPGDAFVDNVTGTGFVHIAPGHGLEDYLLGVRNHLPIYSPVDDDGCFVHTPELPTSEQMPESLVGKPILGEGGRNEANEGVLELLRKENMLVHQEDYVHSYPHCWRSKTPVIFRAMDQWFINVDHAEFRRQALEAIRTVRWIPEWGQGRIEGAVESRPDWCISRQRTWGVPIPAFYDASGTPLLDERIVRRAADLIEREGSNIWFEKETGELWEAIRPEDWDGPEPVNKSLDTLDVWIDSGSSSRAVLRRLPLLQRPDREGPEQWQADVYLEGSDQHRGWFQSSLFLSLAGNGAAPFKTVLTHGFMVDADREKISKSRESQGAYEKPQTLESYIADYGADVLRLWVASQDFRNDIVVSTERIKKVGESYRAIRNALRFQISNLYDFDPEQDRVPEKSMSLVDRWILHELARVEDEVMAAYERCEFHGVYQKLTQFTAVELSAVYHDVVKDRLYSSPAKSEKRRSAQTVLYRIAVRFGQLLSPILVFTADEAWEHLPGHEGSGSIHLSVWQESRFEATPEEIRLWEVLFRTREQVLTELEKARRAKIIGKALEAVVLLVVAESDRGIFESCAEDLRELLNVSQLKLVSAGGEESLEVDEFTHATEPQAPVQVFAAKEYGRKKCSRCWHWELDVGDNPHHPGLCGRCIPAVEAVNA